MSQPAQNRVMPDGRIVASPIRGAWMGNRGQLHDESGTRVVHRRHQSLSWSICSLEFKQRRVPQWKPSSYTPLFFADEAIALAAGHRPCAACRRSAYNDYRLKWAWTHPYRAPSATNIDAQLHTERLPDSAGRRTLTEIRWPFVPAGAFVTLEDEQPAVALNEVLVPYDEHTGRYLPAVERPTSGYAQALTPPSTLAVLQRGYPVQIDTAAASQDATHSRACDPDVSSSKVAGPVDGPSTRRSRRGRSPFRWRF